MTDLRSIARALGGDVAGQQVVAPGPGHSRRDRSLAVRLSTRAAGGLTVHSHCGDDWRMCRDYVLAQLGLSPTHGRSSPSDPLKRTAGRAADEGASPTVDAELAPKRQRAVRLWRAAVDPCGTVVEVYLASRRLDLPADVAGQAIRFHPACPWRDDVTGELLRVPAMVAALRDFASNQIIGVHRTRLTQDGKKVDRRMLGTAAGAAIKLDGDDAVGAGLVIGEGIETVLAARQLGFRPAWAVGSVGSIARFPVLPGVEALTLLAETGDGGASRRAVEVCGTRWHHDGREVIIITPKVNGDVNDAPKGLRR